MLSMHFIQFMFQFSQVVSTILYRESCAKKKHHYVQRAKQLLRKVLQTWWQLLRFQERKLTPKCKLSIYYAVSLPKLYMLRFPHMGKINTRLPLTHVILFLFVHTTTLSFTDMNCALSRRQALGFPGGECGFQCRRCGFDPCLGIQGPSCRAVRPGKKEQVLCLAPVIQRWAR